MKPQRKVNVPTSAVNVPNVHCEDESGQEVKIRTVSHSGQQEGAGARARRPGAQLIGMQLPS